MKKKIIALIINLLPALIWGVWYMFSTENYTSHTLIEGNGAAFAVTVIFALFNAVFIKNLKWYFLCSAEFLAVNCASFYILSVNLVKKVADNQLLVGTQKDAAGANILYSFLVILVCTWVKTYVESYEYGVFGSKRDSIQ